MKTRFNKIVSILLALLLSSLLAAVPINAKSISIQSLPTDLQNAAKLDLIFISNPKEAIEMIQHMSAGDYSDIDNYITDPGARDFFTRNVNLSITFSLAVKTALATINPQNSAKNKVTHLNISSPPSTVPTTKTSTKNGDNYTILAIRNDNRGKININIFFIYKDQQNNLVAVGILRNESGQKLQIDGIPSIQLTENGKKFASGTPSGFETPVKLAPHEAKVNTGVTDGLPTMCFIKMTFAPGTYDDSVDISNLDNVGCIFSLDYSVIQ